MTISLRRTCYMMLGLVLGIGFMASSAEIRKVSAAEPAALAEIQSGGSRVDGGVEEIANGLFRIESSVGSNVLALRGETHSLLVDAGPVEGVAQLQGTLHSLGFGPVSHVIVTHYHDDHLAGAAWFKTRGASVWAHPNTTVEASKDTVISEWNDWHRIPVDTAALPNRSLSDGYTVRIGRNLVRARHMARAHTSGDVVVSFENLGVVHTGDIYEVGAYPFIDHWAGGSVTGMIEAIHTLLNDHPRETIYVPGHGAPGDRTQLVRYRKMLLDVCEKVLAGVQSGDDVNAVARSQPTAPYDDTTWGAARHGRQLTELVYWSFEPDGQNASCSGVGF